MPRHMSFALTRPQIRDRSKTVTRRIGWRFLKAGDEIVAVNKVMGFRKGEHPVVLARLRVVDVRRERLDAITARDVWREGFGLDPEIRGSRERFVEFFCRTHRCFPETLVTRIEFEHLPEVEP